MKKIDTALIAIFAFLYIVLNHLRTVDTITLQQNIIAVSVSFSIFGLYAAARWLYIYKKEKTISYKFLWIFVLCVVIILMKLYLGYVYYV